MQSGNALGLAALSAFLFIGMLAASLLQQGLDTIKAHDDEVKSAYISASK